MKDDRYNRSILAQIQPQCEAVHERIKDEKKRQKKTVQEIADATGVPFSRLNKYLAGNIANVNLHYAAAVCIYLGLSLDELFGIKQPSDADAEENTALKAQVHDLERELEYCRKDRENLIASLNSRKMIITALFGLCILMIATLSIGIIYDSVLPDKGFIQSNRAASISIIFITVIVIAVAATVLIIRRYLFRNESGIENAKTKKRN